jgi:tRNA pseudouridine55 synthase
MGDWQGFINFHKPPGMTSHDAVRVVRRLLRERRVGHSGTLDPMATGVLPIAVGSFTRLMPYLRGTKGYRARVRFGMQTTTDDIEGEVIRQEPIPQLTEQIVLDNLPQFLGVIDQIPPQYSAIRQDGKHLYTWAREGVVKEIPARQVEIHTLQMSDWRSGDFPEMTLDVSCGSGTYIRSLARDLGLLVGGCATLAGLIRTQSNGFSLEDSVDIATLETQLEAGTFQLQDARIALAHLPVAQLDRDHAYLLGLGQQVPWAGVTGLVQVWQADCFMGVAQSENQRLQPVTTLQKVS